ncbi:MAG: cytochrome c3 family protein [Bacteroidales bacterium]
MRKHATIWLLCGVLGTNLGAQSIVNTAHNLSAGGTGDIRASVEGEICLFCHTPHNSRPRSPLWNKEETGRSYILYHSSTVQAVPGQPDGSSLLCLSCHDGTTALGQLLSRESVLPMSSGVTTLPAGASNLGTDLRDDHPVSFDYTAQLAQSDGELKDPSAVLPPVQLEEGRLQCTSCHDPHRDLYHDFLRMPDLFSELCLSCHQPGSWDQSTHRVSTASWNGAGADPWPRSEHGTVAENACGNCHETHGAGYPYRLVRSETEEGVCLACHNGNVAGTNVLAQIVKPYAHEVSAFHLQHDPVEDPLVVSPHVECVDCHNPHAASSQEALPPLAGGALSGVKGVDRNGTPVDPLQYGYELCFRCHADSPLKPASPTLRQVEQNNTRLEFDPANPSHHGVVSAGVNPQVPSLIVPLTTASVIACTDCHASDGSDAPAGPHGSFYPSLLRDMYETEDGAEESASSYALCYGCHSRTSILGDESFDEHDLHIRDENTPCNVCHDPHGISHTQGGSSDHSHLINFDLDVVRPANNGLFRYESTGVFSGRCYLNCHGQNHMGWHYGY